MILAPHPSWLYVLVDFHLQTMQQPFTFLIHLLITYTLTFMIFSSFIVCVTRDPGPIQPPLSQLEEAEDNEMGLREALMPNDDFLSPGRWCRKCWVRDKIRTRFGNKSTDFSCQGAKARESTSLFDLQSMCLENGYIILYFHSFLVI